MPVPVWHGKRRSGRLAIYEWVAVCVCDSEQCSVLVCKEFYELLKKQKWCALSSAARTERYWSLTQGRNSELLVDLKIYQHKTRVILGTGIGLQPRRETPRRERPRSNTLNSSNYDECTSRTLRNALDRSRSKPEIGPQHTPHYGHTVVSRATRVACTREVGTRATDMALSIDCTAVLSTAFSSTIFSVQVADCALLKMLYKSKPIRSCAPKPNASIA
jgi:hypothetical protein